MPNNTQRFGVEITDFLYVILSEKMRTALLFISESIPCKQAVMLANIRESFTLSKHFELGDHDYSTIYQLAIFTTTRDILCLKTPLNSILDFQ